MPEMPTLEKLMCRSAPWRAFTRRVVLPWALQGVTLRGDVLEIGGGSGAMAGALATECPDIRLTMTDYDEAMVQEARRHLAPFGERVRVERADATALDYPDASFDGVCSFIMLHHVGDWERALAEVARVLRPGGSFVGYDLLDGRFVALVHRIERARVRPMRRGELEPVLGTLAFDDVSTRPGLAGHVTRFRARRAA